MSPYGVGHGGDGFDPDAVALRPELAKNYLRGLFSILGGTEQAKLNDMFKAIDALAGSVPNAHFTPLKGKTIDAAVAAFKNMAVENGYKESSLTGGRANFDPESHEFATVGGTTLTLSVAQIEGLIAILERQTTHKLFFGHQ